MLTGLKKKQDVDGFREARGDGFVEKEEDVDRLEKPEVT